MSFEASLVETHQVELEQATRFGKQEGIQIGEQRGEQAAQLRMARQLLHSGIDEALIIQVTGLTQEQLKNLN